MRAAGRTEALRAGLAWLYDVEQPVGAIDQHHGQSVYVAATDRSYGFVPRSLDGRSTAVVVVEVGHPDVDRELATYKVHNPLADGETAQLAELLRAMGHTVINTWNGEPGQTTGSVALAATPHPSLLAAVDRYLAGCPTHETVFCSRDGCPWFGDGNRLLVRPAVLSAST